ncbi:MAG: glycoside hydrolase family 18 [Bacilli bacterium]|nr:glycoside hydrolase family 18 [Bacilli bacterium]
MRNPVAISAIFSVLIALSPASSGFASDQSLPFTDISQYYAPQSIINLYNKGITRGYEDHTFHPLSPISRGEFAAFLTRAYNIPDDSSDTFPDSVGNQFQRQIGALKQRGIVHGKEDRLFHPDDPISRAEMAAMICNLLDLTPGGTSNFTDIPSNYWAKDYINALYEAGIVHGDPDTHAFRPADSITRGETAIVIDQVLQVRPPSTTPVPPVTTPAPSYKGKILGFTDGLSMTPYAKEINQVATFTDHITSNGDLSGSIPTDTVSSANANAIAPLLLVSNYTDAAGFDGTLAASVLQSVSLRQHLETSILIAVQLNHYSGVNIDLENLHASDQADFTLFLQELHQLLVKNQLILTIDVPAKTSDSSYTAYNYASIGATCDEVIIMSYDFNWFGGPAGPIAPIDWVEQTILYATAHIPNQKVMLGIGNYGYDWWTDPTTNKLTAKAFGEAAAVSLANQYSVTRTIDVQTDEYTFTYKDANGAVHTVWFEGPDTARDRASLAKKHGLAGVAIWRLGYEGQDSYFFNEVDAQMGL